MQPDMVPCRRILVWVRKVAWKEIAGVIEDAYLTVAPKTLTERA